MTLSPLLASPTLSPQPVAPDPLSVIGEMLTPKVAVLYLRVSTARQAQRGDEKEGFSIPAQREANRKKAQSMGAMVAKEFVDRGESAKTANRPALQEMLEYIREHSVDYVVVHKVDRLARNREDDVEIMKQLTAVNVALISATESIDQSPSGALLHGIMSSIAEFYSRNLAHEVTKGMTQKVQKGGTPGRAPLGYLNVREIDSDGRESRTVRPDPDRAPLITWAFHRYTEPSVSLSQLALELAQRGLTTRRTPQVPSRTLTDTDLHKILTNSYYLGLVSFSGATYAGKHEPLIDQETWDKVQDALQSRRSGERRRRHDHYLKSTVYCGNCHNRLIVQMTRSKSGEIYPYFYCSARQAKRNDCTQKAVLIHVVEEKIVEEYKKSLRLDRISRDDLERLFHDELVATRGDAERQRAQIKTDLERLEREQLRLLQAHYADAISLDLFKKEQDRIRAERTIAERDEARLTRDVADVEYAIGLALDVSAECASAYGWAPDHVKRLFNQVFLARVLVHADETITVELNEPFATIASTAIQLAAHERSTTRKSGARNLTSFLEAEIGAVSAFFSGKGFSNDTLVPLEGLEPPTCSLGRSRSSIELQRLAEPVYPSAGPSSQPAVDSTRQTCLVSYCTN